MAEKHKAPPTICLDCEEGVLKVITKGTIIMFAVCLTPFIAIAMSITLHELGLIGEWKELGIYDWEWEIQRLAVNVNSTNYIPTIVIMP